MPIIKLRARRRIFCAPIPVRNRTGKLHRITIKKGQVVNLVRSDSAPEWLVLADQPRYGLPTYRWYELAAETEVRQTS